MTRSVLLFLASLACCSAWGHHSAIGVFDVSRTIEVSGIVESFSWRNPAWPDRARRRRRQGMARGDDRGQHDAKPRCLYG